MNNSEKHISTAYGVMIGSTLAVPLTAILYSGNRWTGLPFVPFDLFDWLARILPGDVITAGIDAIVNFINLMNLGKTSETAKRIEQLLAIGLFVITAGLLGGLITYIMDRGWSTAGKSGVFVGIFYFLAIIGIELDLEKIQNPIIELPWIVIWTTSWGVLVGTITRHLADSAVHEEETKLMTNRRVFMLQLAAGSLGLALGAVGLGRLLNRRIEDTGAQLPLAQPAPTVTPTPPDVPVTTVKSPIQPTVTLREEMSPAPGTRPELTPTEDFYRIDINLRPLSISRDNWRLEIAGLFDHLQEITLDDLMAYSSVTQPTTLSCISNQVGGDLIGTSNWTGVRLRDVVADLGLRPEATAILVEAADGFYETVVMRDIMDPRTLLVYGMNGATLPEEHGFPLRIYIPDRYGMKQPKWITRLTAINDGGRGYWVDRGWSKEARPQIVSVIDTVADDAVFDEGLIPIGGIAWAGARGIQKVEVQVDKGEWLGADLRTPPLSPLTWVQWRYDWPATPGRHTIRVRAVDGNGALQIEQERGIRPDGATGYHSVSVTV